MFIVKSFIFVSPILKSPSARSKLDIERFVINHYHYFCTILNNVGKNVHFIEVCLSLTHSLPGSTMSHLSLAN